MKVATTLLIAGVLLAAASFGADNPAASPEAASPEITPAPQAQPPELVKDEALATPAGDCEATGDALIASGLQEPEPVPAAQTCGACSSSNCIGAPRGQACWLGGTQGGWGNCNIYSGGNRCSTGGWECQCGTGPLP